MILHKPQFIFFVLSFATSLTLNALDQKCTCAHGAGAENPSPFLQPGTAIRDIATKANWGELSARLPTDDGWQLSKGTKALDSTYGIKWEVAPKAKDGKTLVDGDGKPLNGDYDQLWWKSAPPKSDVLAYKLYQIVDPTKSINTDGFFDGKLHIIYSDKKRETQAETLKDLSVLKYLTQIKPQAR